MPPEIPVAERRRRFLDAIKRAAEQQKSFSMEVWIAFTRLDDPNCGSYGCAAGWAMMDKDVADAGLGAYVEAFISHHDGVTRKVFTGPHFGSWAIVDAASKLSREHRIPLHNVTTQIAYGDKKWFAALADFLDLPHYMADECFDPESYLNCHSGEEDDENALHESNEIDIDMVIHRVERAFEAHPVT